MNDANGPSSSGPSSKSSRGPSFEDGIKRLSEIVQTLERGDLPLEESLQLFEEGVGLSRASQERLDSAQKRVEELLGFERDGRARTRDFEVRGEPRSGERERED
jgi:exodeoxyribonuclease VII small subunit